MILAIEVEKVVPTSERAQHAEAAEKSAAKRQDSFDLKKICKFPFELLVQHESSSEKP